MPFHWFNVTYHRWFLCVGAPWNCTHCLRRIARIDKNDMQGFNARPHVMSAARATLAKVIIARVFAERLRAQNISVFSLHPGLIKSGIAKQVPWYGKPLMWLLRPFYRSPNRGARTPVYLATANRDTLQSGAYYENCTVKTPSKRAPSPQLTD